MIDDVFKALKDGSEKAQDALKRELTKLRAGRAHPSLLDSVRVDYYGTATPVSQVGTVSAPDARTITIEPWDKSQLKAIEKAIVESGLGLNPQNDGNIIRLPIPALTEERRKELVKLVKKHGEECKVAVRKVRHDAKSALEALEKGKKISKDDLDRALKKVEDQIKDITSKVDTTVEKKEADILSL